MTGFVDFENAAADVLLCLAGYHGSNKVHKSTSPGLPPDVRESATDEENTKHPETACLYSLLLCTRDR